MKTTHSEVRDDIEVARITLQRYEQVVVVVFVDDDDTIIDENDLVEDNIVARKASSTREEDLVSIEKQVFHTHLIVAIIYHNAINLLQLIVDLLLANVEIDVDNLFDLVQLNCIQEL